KQTHSPKSPWGRCATLIAPHGLRLQLQFPSLTHEIDPEAAMRLLLRPHEACALVDVAGIGQNALRPQRDFPISGITGQLDALLAAWRASTQLRSSDRCGRKMTASDMAGVAGASSV